MTKTKRPNRPRLRLVGRAILLLLALFAVKWAWDHRPIHYEVEPSSPLATWEHYGGDVGGLRYSPATQIDATNVHHLREAWHYRTGDLWDGRGGGTAFENTPILVGDDLIVCTPYNRLIALDAETGEERWVFDPELDRSVHYSNQFLCRGVVAWTDPGATGLPCATRILMATAESQLWAIDAADGRPCPGFGDSGAVDLKATVGELAYPGEFHVTSAPIVLAESVIVGSAVGDNVRRDAPSGAVRAFDVRTGAPRWVWDSGWAPAEEPDAAEAVGTETADPVPPADGGSDLAGERVHLIATSSLERPLVPGSPNVWAPVSGDEELGLVYVPTGNPAPDYWAAHREGADHFGSSVVALDATTGEVRWAYQTVHHDLWDFDVPAQPTLFDLRRNGTIIPALVQPTKMGFLFVLDRRTGEPLFEVEERPVPQTDVPGEITAPTQPFPVGMDWLVPTELSPDQAWGFTPFDRGACRERLEQLRFEGMYTPPSLQGTLMYPGNAGGSNWGGVAVDETRGLIIANTMDLAWAVTLFEADQLDDMRARYPDAEFALQRGTPFHMMRETLLSPLGVPCNPPPWGTLAAVDLASGDIRWQVPLGTITDLVPVPIPWKLGVPNIGGPIVTGGGLAFIGATVDDYLRAFDVTNGRELWKGRLPAGGQATPMTYRLRPESKQYVVIAAGGHSRAGTAHGDSVVAFALP